MSSRPYILALVVVMSSTLAAGTAHADKKQFRFVGIHPVPKVQGGGVCHIHAPHVHVYGAIDAKVQFRDHDGWQHFVGDPVAYGWDGDKTAYYGHHPVPVDVIVGEVHPAHPDVEYCYLEGPHYHAWAPPPDVDLDLELRGGAYWYVGTFPEAYVEAQPVYDPIDVVYEPIHYDRPVIEVSVAPPSWYGSIVVAPVVVAPAIVVDAPPPPRPRGHVRAGVEVHVPAPSLRVEVRVPTVQIGISGGVMIGGSGHVGGGKHKVKRGRGHR